jgi:cellulose synthase (UDP-forming)
VEVALGVAAPRADRLEPGARGAARTPLGTWFDRHPALLRAVAVAALAQGGAYLVWRVGWSRDGASASLWTALLVAEVYAIWSLATMTWFSWSRPPVVRMPATPGRAVDVYVCTYDEPVEVVRATLLGCRALTYPHTTWLLDDGRRPEMARLAEELGARHLTRPDNAHAKAGNINHALARTHGELVLVLDADHVPLPDALDALVGWFDDPTLAVVQSPHDFLNQDSVQHYDVGRHEQSVFYEVVQPGKGRHGAAFWCGSATLLRRRALLEIGGVATETIAEDFHTTIRLQRAGWRTRYQREVLVQGLAPFDLAGYLLQRDRWARGNLAVFRTPESPLRARELSAAQRVSYLASLLAYLAGPVRALLLATLGAVLLTGWLPLALSTPALLGLWLPAVALNLAAGAALGRGYVRVREAVHFEQLTAGIHLRALGAVLTGRRRRFRVTPKEGADPGGWTSVRQLTLLLALGALLVVGLGARVVDGLWLDRLLTDLPGHAAWVVPALALAELRRVGRSLYLVSRHRQRRAEFRFPAQVHAVLAPGSHGGVPVEGRAVDLNGRGVRLRLPVALRPGERRRLSLTLSAADGRPRPVELDVEVVSCRAVGNRWEVGGRFVLDPTDPFAPHRREVLLEWCYVAHPYHRLRDEAPAAPVAEPARR